MAVAHARVKVQMKGVAEIEGGDGRQTRFRCRVMDFQQLAKTRLGSFLA